jgi:sugar O-acyltransferase (sialic acid O-acetyltransferase NeuD family)
VECVLYGIGSPFVEEVIELLRRLDWTVRGGVANMETDFRPERLTPIVGPGEIPPDWLSLPVALALVTPGHRWSVEREALVQGFGAFATVVDPTASVASSASLGEGGIVCPGVLVGACATLGRLACLNKGAIVGHHAELADYSSLGPGCTLCGYVSLGRGAFVGAGAVVNPEVSIGANAVVASGSVVRRDVPAHMLVAGNPAVAISEVVGYNDVAVGEPPDLPA